MKKTGFTLSEVLVTLGVIGVISAMTLPTVIKHYQQQVTVNRLKKAYSEFAQVIQKAENDKGLLENWDFLDFETPDERVKYFCENYLFPYIKTVKKCVPTSNECWADNIKPLGTSTSTAHMLENDGNGRISFVTNSGYSVYVWLHGTGTGMWYIVDVNGVKPPNKVGRDIFEFQANWGNTPDCKYGVYPFGLESKTAYTRANLLTGIGFYNRHKACIKAANKQNGQTCAAVIMLDGWKIKDDYPW